MSEIFLIIGLGIFIIGGIGFLIAAFKTSMWWGFGCLLVSPVQLFYLFFYWSDAKKPFLIQVIGGVMMIAAAYTGGSYQF